MHTGPPRCKHTVSVPLRKTNDISPQPPTQTTTAGRGWSPAGQIALLSLAAVLSAGLFVGAFYYVKYARLIDRKLAAGPFSDTYNIYSAPRTVVVGDRFSPQAVAAMLRRSGYSASHENPMGFYNLRPDAIEIFPGRNSYYDQEAGVIQFSGGAIARIISLRDNTERGEYQLEPQLITNLSDRNRAKRRLVRFSEIPQSLVHAVISAEDKRFFQHGGIDVARILKAAYVDLKEGRKEQGASTLSMQLARSLWLTPDKSWKRKSEEVLIALHLEHRLNKQKIFEDYSNQVYLGRHGSYAIMGFGEAARAFFGKDIARLNLPESATLAGLVQRPSYFNPFRFPERARSRRNIVLSLMRQNGYISRQQEVEASQTPLVLSPGDDDSEDAAYFLDLVNDELQDRLGEESGGAKFVYTTLDLALQKAAEEAVSAGMHKVDQRLAKRHKAGEARRQRPQVALVALDPHTGSIRALCGGRDYSASQLNHVLARRQPGSVFKPFVYAAGLNTAISGGPKIYTPATTIVDEPTTFWFNGKPYEPTNFHEEFLGTVTLRRALAQSLNSATVKLAESVGLQQVVDLARRAGLPSDIQPTPAVALGAYEVTPLELAGAYTMFANHGDRTRPAMVTLVRSRNSQILYRRTTHPTHVLDPRVAFLVTNMLQTVIDSGTGARARRDGFRVPAAGKTGTSRDGWFVGFTSRLLCVVWVGFDDNSDLDLEGSRSALPIWTDFMKRALKLRKYRDVNDFQVPDGIVSARICPASGLLAGPYCPHPRSEVFIDGTQPVVPCLLHRSAPPEPAYSAVPERLAIHQLPDPWSTSSNPLSR